MEITSDTPEKLVLKIPRKNRYVGLLLMVLGILLSIILMILNNYQIYFTSNEYFKSIIFNSSLSYLLAYIFLIEIPCICYLLSIKNLYTSIGHILLLLINITGYIATSSSILAFSPVFITGFYYFTHFKSIIVDKEKSNFKFQERLFLIFYRSKIIPFSEIEEFTFEYKIKQGFLNKKEIKHQYCLKLYLFERDPGFEDIPLKVEDEVDSPNFFRPHTLRKTLLQHPTLIDSSFFNFKNNELKKFEKIINKLLQFTGFHRVEEIKKDRQTIIKFRK